ncbi:MAG: hypothetical protein ACI4KF_12975 [Huintestinicola sp.]
MSNIICITLTVDEYEVIRLIDLEQLNHAQAAERMNISGLHRKRQTPCCVRRQLQSLLRRCPRQAMQKTGPGYGMKIRKEMIL